MNLRAEWMAAAERGISDRRLDDYLNAQGVNSSLLSAFGYPTGVCVVGLMNIDADPDGWFEPNPDGRPAIVMPTMLYDGMEPEDLIAWRSDSPGTVWRRTGASEVLDPWSLHLSTLEAIDAPLTVLETPLAWLKSGCSGAVVLDWSEHLFLTFSGVRSIVADLPIDKAENLERMISPKAYPVASISLPESRMGVAA